MDVLGSIITAGVAVLAIALIAVITANTMGALPAVTDPVWNDTMTGVATNASTAFDLLGIAPLVLAAAVIIAIIVGAFMVR
jgi:hypothetical protein